MEQQPVLAAVDLGSNSFRLQVAKIEGEQLYMLDGLREPVRLAAGLTADNYLDEAAQQRALSALARFAERLRELPPEAVRVVGTNSLRVAVNAAEFIARAELVLGFPIEVIAGREEARLIYLGVAHGLPPSDEQLLVMDIGGGSTEFIIGHGLTPIKLESLYMGCISYSCRFFPDGKITRHNLEQAELAARNELQTIVADYKGQWQKAIGSSGTAKAIAEILEMNGFSRNGITRDGLDALRAHLLKVGDVQKLGLLGLRPDRVPAIAGGFAIMYAAFVELDIKQMQAGISALREGVLYDLWGRFHNNDMRDVTVQHFMRRYHVDVRQAERVNRLASVLARQFFGEDANESALQVLGWVALLHGVGIRVAHSGYHKHTAYILANADMPGFSKKEQLRLSLLALAHRGNLKKLQGLLTDAEDWVLAMSLRLAALFYRNRSDVVLPDMQVSFNGAKYCLAMDSDWLKQNPLTETALREEVKQWKTLGVAMQLIKK
jgi:exopolyphosphatase / guanosine-5'-triphosphate,3'-diphosphate pyrophosphatase